MFHIQRRNRFMKFRTKHVHFNKQVKIVEIPRNVCTFRRLSSISKKQTSWKYLQNHDCEQVTIDPKIVRRATKELHFKPSVDLFAYATHHQLPRYYSKTYDPKAVRTNAFSINWNLEAAPYVNPPWSLIPNVLDKISTEQVKVMIVLPFWTQADWFPLLKKLMIKYMILEEPIYLRSIHLRGH